MDIKSVSSPRLLFTLALIVIGVSSDIVAGTSEIARTPPRLEDYPVMEVFKGKPKAVDLASHPDARKYRTYLRQGSNGPPNFAGHFRVILIGCGAPCQWVFLVDSKTGGVYFAPFDAPAGADYRVDSALFIAGPPEAILEYYSGEIPAKGRLFYSYYYVWSDEKKEFTLIFTDEK